MTYDSKADAAYLTLVDSIGHREVATSSTLDLALENSAIVVDFDAAGRALGLEVLGASRVFLPAVLETVVR